MSTLDASATNTKSQPTVYASVEASYAATIHPEFKFVTDLATKLDSAMTEASSLASNSTEVATAQKSINDVNT